MHNTKSLLERKSPKRKEKLVVVNQPTKNSSKSFTELQIKPDDVCNTFCSSSKNKKECSRFRKDAQSANSILLQRYSKFELEQAILGELDTSIEELLKQVLKEKNLISNGTVLFCTQGDLTNQLMSETVS